MILATLIALHGDDPQMDLLYFWAAVLIALTPVLIFGTIGVLVLRQIWKERELQRTTRNAERGTEGPA